MKKIGFLLSVIGLIFLCFSDCHAFWVWTPKTKGWVNPKHAPKSTPQKQFDYAKSFYDNEEYKSAAVEFEKLVNSYSGSSLAPDAGYYSGLSYQREELYYKAFVVYDKILSQYPNSKRTSQIVEKMYEIGNVFLDGKKRKILGLELLPALATAEQIFATIVDNAPYSELGDDAQFQMGECYKKMKEYAKAVEAFEKVIKKYPESSLVDNARYQIAICSLMASQPSEYEQGSTDKAIREFKDFIDETPPEDLVEEAQKAISRLESKKAKHEYEIAQYYESRRGYDSAIIYYRSVITNYPGTKWAEMAKENLKKVKEKQKK
ncbi:MAG: outer membrane protein assembly factor BamD [Candidatus Omnitrophica bacterium]|nr:outer membrane protein assembly factor BamD [Candidatus Omnitrophota bacterium]